MAGIIDVMVCISKKVVVDVTWDTGVPLHPEHIFVNISKTHHKTTCLRSSKAS